MRSLQPSETVARLLLGLNPGPNVTSSHGSMNVAEEEGKKKRICPESSAAWMRRRRKTIFLKRKTFSLKKKCDLKPRQHEEELLILHVVKPARNRDRVLRLSEVYMCVYKYMYVYVHVCVCIWICMYRCMYIRERARAHTHTHKIKPLKKYFWEWVPGGGTTRGYRMCSRTIECGLLL